MKNRKSANSIYLFIYLFIYFYTHRLIHIYKYGVVHLNSGHKSIKWRVYIWNSFKSTGIIFLKCLELHSIILNKIFSSHPLNGQNLLSVTNCFCRCSLNVTQSPPLTDTTMWRNQINAYLLSVFSCISFLCTVLNNHLGRLPFLEILQRTTIVMPKRCTFFFNGPRSYNFI